MEVEEEETAIEVLKNATLFGHVSFSENTWLCKQASRIGFLMALGGAYIRTICSHLASCEYVRSSQWKFATLALRTCHEASRATCKVFLQPTIHAWNHY